MRVKVCGVTLLEQAEELDEMGVSFAGFIFYPKSPRYVFRHLTTTQLKKERKLNKVGVFVNSQVDELLTMVDECGLHMVQLHGDETPKYCEKIADYISVIKAFRITEQTNIERLIRDYMDVCDMFMFDTEGAGYGGTNHKLNLDMLKNITVGKPFFLAGGIENSDADAIRKFAQEPVGKGLFAVDINTKFEVSPGIKDMDKIRSFLDEMKEH